MYEALFRQDFKDVRIRMEPNVRSRSRSRTSAYPR